MRISSYNSYGILCFTRKIIHVDNVIKFLISTPLSLILKNHTYIHLFCFLYVTRIKISQIITEMKIILSYYYNYCYNFYLK